jgi:restriction endonuclease S subunit
MMVFQKGVGATDNIEFISLIMKEPNSIPDHEVKPLIKTTLEELRSKHYSLNYKQYLPQSALEVEGFEMVKLGDLIVADSGDLLAKDAIIKGDYPIIGGGKVVGYHNTSNRNADEIVISRVGNACLTFMSGKYYLTDNALAIISKDHNKMLIKYLYFYLTQNIDKLREQYSGTAQPVISKTRLYEIQIPLPSLERQQQILEAIDGWVGLSQHEEEALKLLEKQAMFQVKEMGRGQSRVKLATIAKDITFGFMVASGDYGTEGVPVIKTKNIKSKRVMYPADDQKIQTKLDEKYRIKKGDMLIVLGGSPGENGIWEFDEEAWLNQDCAKISIENPVTRMYVFYSLQGQVFNDYIESNTTKTTIGHISRGVVRDIEIPLPPLTEQQTLQSDFDEIRHKHAKIAMYKAKAQEAIQRLIPGAQ